MCGEKLRPDEAEVEDRTPQEGGKNRGPCPCESKRCRPLVAALLIALAVPVVVKAIKSCRMCGGGNAQGPKR